MGQSKANQWLHVLLPALLAAWRALGDAPARSLTALAQRLGISEADAATVVTPLAEEPAPVVAVPAAAPTSPLVPLTAPSGASSAPKALLHRPRIRAARQRTTPSKMACWSMRPSRSSFSARQLEAVSMRSVMPRRPRIPCRREAGCGKISASWRSRSPQWRSSCPPSNPAARRSPWRSNWRTKPCTLADDGSSTSTAVASAVASRKTGFACGSRASGIW
jgi:hypothetical protein